MKLNVTGISFFPMLLISASLSVSIPTRSLNILVYGVNSPESFIGVGCNMGKHGANVPNVAASITCTAKVRLSPTFWITFGRMKELTTTSGSRHYTQ